MVEVTHSQKDSHEEVDCCLERVVILTKRVSITAGDRVSSIPISPSETGMKDYCFTTLFSPGKAWVCQESVTLLNICLPIYSNRSSGIRQPLEDECLYLSLKGCLGTLCLGLRRKSLLRSLRNLRCLLISERCI